MGQCQEYWTDQITSQGSIRRIYSRFLITDDNNTNPKWYYFGTTAIDKPPGGAYKNAPVTQFSYVQLPNDLDILGPDYNYLLFNVNRVLALAREGIVA